MCVLFARICTHSRCFVRMCLSICFMGYVHVFVRDCYVHGACPFAHVHRYLVLRVCTQSYWVHTSVQVKTHANTYICYIKCCTVAYSYDATGLAWPEQWYNSFLGGVATLTRWRVEPWCRVAGPSTELIMTADLVMIARPSTSSSRSTAGGCAGRFA